MDDKYYIVLKKLIDTEDQAVTAKEIADGLNVSVRTIFRYVNVINQLDDKESFRIVSIKNKGLMLRILNKTDFDAFLESMDNDQQLTEEQIEFLEMIIMSEPTEADVADFLCYSISSINRLINDLNNKLMSRRMNIRKCKGKILMDGSEVQIRNFMQYLWSSYPGTEEFFLHNCKNAYLRFKSYADQIGIDDEDVVSYIYILMERFIHAHSIVFSQIITGLFKNDDDDNNKVQKIGSSSTLVGNRNDE